MDCSGDGCTGVVDLGQQFNSFDQLKIQIENHGIKNNVQWVKSDAKTVKSANKTITEPSKMYDERFVYRYVRYKCKHGGKRKRAERKDSTSLTRPNQKTFKIDCPAEIYASVDKTAEKIVIRSFNEQHNHATGVDAYKSYPEQRRLDDETLTSVEQMLKMKVDIKYIQKFVFSKGKNLSLRDIRNIRHKMKKKAVDEEK